MKITVKTTQQKVFQLEVESGETVAALKAKIHELQGHPVAVQKIIYSGKILTDDKTIDSCGIKEKDFLVLMVSKPTPVPAPSATSGITSEPAPSQIVPHQMEPTIPATAPPEVTPDTPASSRSTSDTAPSSLGDPGTFLSGDSLQGAINNIIDMGFPRDQVLRAMRASFNNADRAVEYLTTGFPAHAEVEAPSPAVSSAIQTQPPVVTNPSSTTNQHQNLFQVYSVFPSYLFNSRSYYYQQLAQQQQQAGVSGPGAQPNLETLRDNPQIQQLREQIVQNPALLQFLIQQLASQNPMIAQILAENPEALLQHLGIEHSDGDGDGDGDGTPIPPGATVVSVTEEERAAIQRLEALGFPRQDAAEAYFACDKNEELAANYLFESFYDDHSDQ
ncbi:UV excision repair protein Rad23 [Phlegmacium glaucopus]|nr:UV excision repair protein Rad23 [Phlegmacium glaucopus]